MQERHAAGVGMFAVNAQKLLSMCRRKILQRLGKRNAKGRCDRLLRQRYAQHLLESQLEAADHVRVAVQERAVKIEEKSGILFHENPP